MSVKTKKQKIAAQTRKILKLQEAYNPRPVMPQQLSAKIIKESVASSSNDKPSSLYKSDLLVYFRSDIKKSVFFVASIIALEIFLYFVRIK